MTSNSLTVGGIVLCGGQSTRMGRPKALLPFGLELMLQRVVRILGGVVAPIVVVAARDQALPDLPTGVRIARDEHESLGPLAGLAAGLSAIRGDVDAAYVSSCDAPLLKPEFVRHMIDALGDDDLAIPRDGKYHHPLAAVYRTSVETAVRDLLASHRLRPFFLLERVRAREIDVGELRAVDADLQSLRNTNTPEDYRAALAEAGLEEGTPSG
ncbi:MAG TPA: molybdenum cofactor guanylyltransferase [Planctomycetaceae bacterium]|nr:molybdenum cofactor guanylyltransferase [Planctomycetaceae bacterium]